jgi:hypothetical protein
VTVVLLRANSCAAVSVHHLRKRREGGRAAGKPGKPGRETRKRGPNYRREDAPRGPGKATKRDLRARAGTGEYHRQEHRRFVVEFRIWGGAEATAATAAVAAREGRTKSCWNRLCEIANRLSAQKCRVVHRKRRCGTGGVERRGGGEDVRGRESLTRPRLGGGWLRGWSTAVTDLVGGR